MLTEFSNQIAEIVARVAPSIVQVQGSGRPASGLVYASGVVLTTVRAVGREEHPRVRRADGEVLEAEPIGWDPATRLAVLRAAGVDTPAPAAVTGRVGEVAIALARSWSNAITATAGLVSVIGGPLPTGRRRAIEQVIRTSAPMHEGFSGGALVGADGGLLGVTTAASIRGLGVVIPAAIAWATAANLLQHGTLKRGYLGIAAQPVSVPEKQRAAAGTEERRQGGVPGDRETALLVVGVKDGTPADAAGLLVGDVLLALDGNALTSPEELFDLLVGDRVGRTVTMRVLRGGSPVEVQVTVGER
jgi:S1-C subfamily serine protease